MTRTPVADEIARSIPGEGMPATPEFRVGMEVAMRIAREFERAAPTGPAPATRAEVRDALDHYGYTMVVNPQSQAVANAYATLWATIGRALSASRAEGAASCPSCKAMKDGAKEAKP